MSNCNLPTFEELANSVKNKKFIKVVSGKTQQDIVEGVDFTHSNFFLKEHNVPTDKLGTDRRRYTLRDSTDVFLKSRVTDRTSLMYNAIYGNKGKNQDSDNMEYGNTIHAVLQEAMEQMFAKYSEGTPTDPQAIIDKYSTGDYSLSVEHLSNLLIGAKDLFDQIVETQNKIDPNGKFALRTEKIVIDPVHDVGGTIDVLVVFSDSTAGIFDFKSFSISSMYTTVSGGTREIVSNDFIAKSKRDAWKLQTSTYKKILLEVYNLKDIRFTRIVPIWLDSTTDENNKIVQINNVQIGEKQSEFLRQRTVEGDKFSDAAVDLFLETVYKEISELEKTYSKLSRSERSAVESRLNKLHDAVDDFAIGMNINSLLQDALDIASKDYESFDELNKAINYISAIVNLKRNLQDSSRSIELEFDEDKLNQVNKRLALFKSIREEKLLDNLNTEGYGELNTVGGKIILSEDDIITQTALPTSKSENPIIQYANDLFSKSYTKQYLAIQKFDKEFARVESEVIKWLNSKGETLADVHKYILNREEGRLHYRLSSDFYDKIQAARNSNNHKFFTDNYQIRSKNGKGETYLEWYKRSYEEQKKILEDRYSRLRDEPKAKAVSKALEFWESNFNLQTAPNGTPLQPKAWLNKNNSWLELKASVIKSNQSEEYKVISSNKPLLDYYEFILDTVKDWRKTVGYDEIKSSYFYPMVRATAIEKLTESNMYALMTDVRQMFEIRQDDQTFGSRDFDKEIEKSIPVYFTQPFRDANGEFDPSQLSTDVSASMRLFSKIVYNYQYMSEIESEMLAAKEMLKTVEYEQAGWGKNIFNFMHNIATKDKSESGSMTDTIFSTLVDYHLYGIKIKPFLGNEKITANVTKLMNWFSLRSLGLGFVPATASYVSSQINARFEAVKGQLFSTQDWNNSIVLSGKEYKKYHALAYYFGVHNEDMVTDIVSSRVGSKNLVGNMLYNNAANQYINQRMLMRPWSYGEERLENHITVTMANTYGVDSNGNVRKLENLPEGSKSIYERMVFNEEDASFKIEGLDEEQTIRYITQFKQAVRAAQKRITGTMSSEDIAYWQTNLAGRLVMMFKSWMPNVLEERFGKLRYNKILDSVEQGRYAALWQNNELEENANTLVYILSSTMNLAKFVTSNLIINNSLARKVFGTNVKLHEDRLRRQYREFQNRYEKYPGVLERIPSYEAFVKMKEGQIKAALAELEVYILLSMAIAMLGADWDDDGEPMWSEMWVTRKIYRVLNRTKTELSFTYSYAEYIKLMQNPIPLTSALNNVLKLLGNTLDEVRDTALGENNPRDNAGKLHYTTGMFTGVYQLRKFFDVFESDKVATR